MKRLFFGAEVSATWPKEFPPGRILEEPYRHITLAFLGTISLTKILDAPFPKPTFPLGPAGFSSHLAFLTHVVAAVVTWLDSEDPLASYHQSLNAWLKQNEYKTDERKFLPHITLARSPTDLAIWEKTNWNIPLYVSAIHLYESLGNSHYKPLWNHPFVAPFEEIEHTADIAFLVRGKTLAHILLHAQLALAFKFPSLLSDFIRDRKPASLDDIVIALNDLIATLDCKMGCPFKAVSFHGEIMQRPDNLLEWKMIVDV